VCLAIALGLAWRVEQTPEPAPRTAPASEFAALRAMADIEAIAAAPHPIGTQQNAKVRDHVLARMRALGLETRVLPANGVSHQRTGDSLYIVGGAVENIVGVLPGADRSAPAVAIMAHYDSVPGSPGAADDAAGVAAALEIARALKTQGQAARDVILLITDGEEAGLLGARAFFAKDPLARRIGFMINLEARGGGGRAQMFQTGPQNGQVIELFKRSAVSPVSSSLAVFIYEHMPNDTDFTVSKEAGVPGLNYAFIGGQFDYHSPTSTPANLDKGSLQHLGEQALAAARATTFADALPASAPDLVYAHTFGSHILAYPAATGWGVLALAAALLAVGLWRAGRLGALTLLDVAKGIGAALYLVLFSAILLRLARLATGVDFGFQAQRTLLAQASRWEASLTIVGLGALILTAAAVGRGRMRLAAALAPLAAGLACLAWSGWDPISLGLGIAAAILAAVSFGRPAGVAGAWTGVLATGFAAAIAMQALAPATAFLVAWPLVVATLLGAVSAMGARRPIGVTFVIAALAALGVAWLLGFGHGIFLGLDQVELLALIVWLTALLVWPLAQPAERERKTASLGLALLLLGFIGVLVVRLDPPWSERFPRATQILYYVDLAGQRTLRVSNAPGDFPWVRDALAADGGEIGVQTLPLLGAREVMAAPAKPVSAPAPSLTHSLQADGSHRMVLNAPGAARTLALDLRPSVALSALTVNGDPVAATLKPGRWTRVRWQSAPHGVAIGFRASGAGAVEARYAAVTEAWPAAASPLPARPRNVMAAGNSDSTVVADARRFTWRTGPVKNGP
jgi:hypothetical protein